MKKSLIWQKKVGNFEVRYGLINSTTEIGEVYGIYIEKMENDIVAEREEVFGLTQDKMEMETFLQQLWNGRALPVELIALCDDYLSEKEKKDEFKMAS